MQSDPTAKDAAALIAAIVANQPTALEGAPFTPGAADAQRAGLEYYPSVPLGILKNAQLREFTAHSRKGVPIEKSRYVLSRTFFMDVPLGNTPRG